MLRSYALAEAARSEPSRTRKELVLCASLRIWSFFGHITPCACGVRGASAACDGFGFARKTAAPFDIFYWLQVTNFDVLFDSAPEGANHFDVWDFDIHAKMVSRLDRLDWFLGCLLCNRNFDEFIAYPNIGNRRATGYRTKVPSRQSRSAHVYEVGSPQLNTFPACRCWGPLLKNFPWLTGVQA
jgi:hypothetical protein